MEPQLLSHTNVVLKVQCLKFGLTKYNNRDNCLAPSQDSYFCNTIFLR